MKFTDLDKTLITEAPPAEGKLRRAATAVKKKVGPTKKIRQRAAGKAGIQKQALDIKSQFHTWSGEQDRGSSVEDFKAFAEEQYPQLVSAIDDVAAKLKFTAPVKAEPEPEPGDSAEQQVEPVSGEEQEELISPEEMTGEKGAGGEQSEEEIRAAYKKQGEELEAERIAKGGELGEEVDEDTDDENAVDTSASIYEARLNYFLLLEKNLKDNQLDTLIVRVIQAAAKGGAKTGTSGANEPERKATSADKEDFKRLVQRVKSDPKSKVKGDKLVAPDGSEISLKHAGIDKESPEDGWRQKISRALTGTGDVRDIGKGGSDDVGGDSAPTIDPDDLRALTGLLSTVAKGKAGPNEKKMAGKLLKSLKNTYGE